MSILDQKCYKYFIKNIDGKKEELKNLLLKEFSTLKITNKYKLEEYVDFCINQDLKSRQPFSTALHHILPCKVFSMYSNMTLNKWNGVYLTYSDHYSAHSLLAEAVNHPSIIGAWWGMNNLDKNSKSVNGIEILGAERYSNLIIRASEETSRRNAGLVMCRLKNSPSTSIKVSKEEFNENRHLYLSNNILALDKYTI